MTEAKKIKRNHRMLYICQYLMEHPNELISLSKFVDYFNCAKSSISEDVDFVREVFESNGIGEVKTIAGVSGGVIYYPKMTTVQVEELFHEICDKVAEGKRILPGNYIYVGDLLQDSQLLNRIAKLIANKYQSQQVDAVMTVETKGIGLSVAVARYLNVPYVVVRRDSKDAEGSTISVNYISGSHQTVSKMELSKRSLKAKSNVLVVDDFMRNGGTISGMLAMIEEFDCQCVGVCVFAENSDHEKQPIVEYDAIIKIHIAYNDSVGHFTLDIEKGSFFDKK